MTRFPLLEAMRAERNRREAEIIAPYRAELSRCGRQIATLEIKIAGIEKMVGSEMGKRALDEIAHDVASRVQEVIMTAIVKTGRARDDGVTIALTANDLRYLDPRSLERTVLDEYTKKSLPYLRLSTERMSEEVATVIDIRIPELGARRVVAG